MPDKLPPHPEINSISDAVVFKLSRLTALNNRVGASRFRAAHDITLNEWRVLGLIGEGSPARFDTIRRTMQMDKGQLSRTVKALTEAGLVHSTPNPQDARQLDLTLTEAGQARHDSILDFTRDRNQGVVAPLTRKQCQKLLEMLDVLIAHNQALADALQDD